jgi:hypothetical protein
VTLDYATLESLRANHPARVEAMQYVLDHIEMFCNPTRRYSPNEQLSPLNSKKRCFERLSDV